MPVYRVLPERLGVLSVQAECPLRPSGPLLIRGFGVRVPGGAPVLTWGFGYSRSFFVCPFCPHVGSVLARKLGPGRGGFVQSGGSGSQRGLRRLSWRSQWSIPSLNVVSFGSWEQLRSVKPAGSVQPHERRTGGRDAASRKSRACADDGIGRSPVTSAGEPLRLHRRIRWDHSAAAACRERRLRRHRRARYIRGPHAVRRRFTSVGHTRAEGTAHATMPTRLRSPGTGAVAGLRHTCYQRAGWPGTESSSFMGLSGPGQCGGRSTACAMPKLVLSR
jgi:hypothetical protein